MRPLRYAINVTLDGCVHHEAGLPPDEESMRFWTAEMERADALIFGRTTYEMMEAAWRQPATGTWPEWMDETQLPFAEAIDGAIRNDPDTEVKKRAVFALTQMPDAEGVPQLIRVAKTNRNPEVREQAVFWLGQSEDPRALDFIEQILTR